MASVRTADEIGADLRALKEEIKTVKESIANPLSDADRVQDKIRLNHLYDKEKRLETERMLFPRFVSSSFPIAPLPCFFLAPLVWFFPPRRSVEGNAAGGHGAAARAVSGMDVDPKTAGMLC